MFLSLTLAILLILLLLGVEFLGHGGRLVDQNNDEDDGYDETMIPVDFKTQGQIRDDDLLRILVRPLKEGVLMTCLMDCCHSGKNACSL